MVGFAPCSALIAIALAAPELPTDDATAPDPAAEATAEATAVEAVSEPDPQPDPELVPEPSPEPSPQPRPEFTVSSERSPDNHFEEAPLHAHSGDANDDDWDNVARFEPGLWGMQFTFGGLAPMSIAGLRDLDVNRLVFTELGFRRVLNNDWALLFGLGAGVFRHNPEEGDTQHDVGLSASYGFLHWFRVWRRIAPYVGGRFRVSYAEPEGRSNWNVGVGLGPMLGVEYFVGDRVSLSLQGDAQLGFGIFQGLVQTELATRIDAGGQMGLTFYF